MKNRVLAEDYLRRAKARLKAIDALFSEDSFADVVRESQEIVELATKAVLRAWGVEPARVHDVSEQLAELKSASPKSSLKQIEILIAASRELRRDRELAFYGGEDLTPGEFYKREDGERARKLANECVMIGAELFLVKKA